MPLISPPNKTNAAEHAATTMRAGTVTGRVALTEIELVASVAEDLVLVPTPSRLLAVILGAEAVNPPKLPGVGK